MPFDQLFATPGIGQKKINCLIELYMRAAWLIRPGGLETARSMEEPALIRGRQPHRRIPCFRSAVGAVATNDPRQRIGRQNPGPLGSLVATVAARDLEYAARRVHLAESGTNPFLKNSWRETGRRGTRSLRFVARSLGRQQNSAALVLQVMPKFVAEYRSLGHRRRASHRGSRRREHSSIRSSIPDAASRESTLAKKLRLAASRLRLDGSGATVRQVARQMDLTRARVYTFGRHQRRYLSLSVAELCRS